MSNDAVKHLVDDKVVMKQIAALAASGAGRDAIIRELGISRYLYTKLTSKAEFARELEKIGDESVGRAVQQARTRMSNLVSDAVAVVATKLKEGELDAAKEVFKLLGLHGKEETKVADTSINIIMPGQQVDSAIEVQSENISEKHDEPTE